MKKNVNKNKQEYKKKLESKPNTIKVTTKVQMNKKYLNKRNHLILRIQ